MVKFVFDADGCIKLTKAGVMNTLTENATCIMPKQAYDEVLKGKERLYDDAFVTEKLVTEKKIKVVASKEESDMGNLGAGEKSALYTYKAHKAFAIISDDAKFISALEREKIRFMIPTDAIVWLVKQKKLSEKQGMDALDKIRGIVRKSAYTKAKKLVGGE
jgi:hypothetical protein